MRTRQLISMSVVVLAASMGGCGERATSGTTGRSVGTTSADCAYAVQYAHVTYTEVGYLDQVGRKVGFAVVGDCDDLGPDAPGVTFQEGASTIETWSVAGAGTDDAIAVRDTVDPSRWRVLVSTELSDQEARRLVVDLDLHV